MSVNQKILEPKDEILPGYSEFENFTKDGYTVLIEAIKNSNCLPTGRDWNFYQTHNAFKDIVNKEGSNILKLMQRILKNNDIDEAIFNRVLEEKTELVIEANDVILEKVANNIDELNGIRKITVEPILIQAVSAQIPINGSWNRINSATFSVSSSINSEPLPKNGNAIRLLTAKNILRPQKFFKDKIINSGSSPWEPRLKEKPNSLKPLAIFLEETENGEEYSHPYEFELDKFTPLKDQLKKENPVIPHELKNTPLVEINSLEHINELIEELRDCKEFAVDLEHHSYRSFMGITCLLQISTNKKDYLIDTLALRDKLYLLNEVFTKPSIVKIFHGADMDIQWLQRDLSIYVVNMFDTHQAAKQLSYSGLSLAYLMQRFCNFVPNKHFQLADWRIRPLPEELKLYAREDTHYLIYIYQMMKNELLNKDNGQNSLLLSVINNSTKICKKRYFKPVLREDSHLDFYRKCKRLFDNRQLYALKELYKWRDQISREEDESTGYVLPNHMLLQISETLPREMQGILACCNPIPPLVRANLLELHQIVLRAKEQPLEKPIMKEDTRARGITLKMSKINVDSSLHCPHDLTKSSEFRDDLPTLLSNNSSINLLDLINTELKIEKSRSNSSVFNMSENLCQKVKIDSIKKLSNIGYLGPFERYKLVKPYIQAEEEKLAAEKAAKNENVEESNTEDIRTDEQRIESIREHFLTLARKPVPSVEITHYNQSLLQMGGIKKRKREPSPVKNLQQSELTNVQTTIPTLNTTNVNSRKRKSTDLQDESTSVKIQAPNVHNQRLQNKIRKTIKNRQNKRKQNNETQTNQNLNSCGTINVAQHSKSEGSRYQSQKGKYKKKQKFTLQTNRQVDGNESFSSYDYSSVDFRQFQGGAQVVKNRQFKSSFKYKGKKKNVNKSNNNKSTTFFGNGGKKGR